ncbi:MAG: hypothetical protein M3477_03960, partial [Gemmatimonadota bacterium]|nr:hypothetical protein [Gemmatimonadota bacterium]
PAEPVMHSRGIKQESFLVETRSLGGYSGSPVFLRIPHTSVRPSDRRAPQPKTLLEEAFPLHGEGGPWLLGLDYGHLPLIERVRSKTDEEPVPSGEFVRSNSGVMGVVPAWRLLDLLNMPEVVQVRDKHEREIAEIKKKAVIVLDVAADESRSGPEPERLKITGDWEDATKRALNKGKPSKASPKRGKRKR